MLSNLSNNNSGNQTKSVVEKKHYRDIEKRLDELQDEIEMTEQGVSTNSQAIASLDGRVAAVEDNSTFPELNTDTINPATGNGIDVTGNLDVDGAITADFANFGELSVNGTSFTTVKDNAAQAKSIAENAENKADEAYELADALSDELADYKADNEQSITTGTLNADSVITDSVAAQTINTNDFETTNAEIDKLYVDTIKATGFLELPTTGQSYYTITVPAKTTASFSGIYTSSNNTDYPFYFTVSDGAVIYKQSSTEIIKDISFDRETGNTKVRFKSSTNLTYISTALDSNPVTIEDGGDAYTDYAFIPQKTGGYLIRGYDDTTTEIYIAGVLRAYAMSIEEEIIERTSVDFLKVNASIELPQDWDAGGTISYSTGEENQYISAQTKAGVTKPTWTSPIHSTIGSLSYSSKLVDEATIASYKGISETRQTQTISITNEASLQQLTAFHWTKNGTYWQPYELTRITIGDNTMWIDPTEANQGIRFSGNQVIADGTWNDVPVEEANAVPVNLVIFDAPTELSFPITNLGDKTTVHGEITATCFKGNVLGNVTGNADTATNATCFDNKTYAEAKADILSGCAADSNMFNGKTYSEAKTDILSGNAATATNATCFNGCTYSQAKADILSGNAATATNATCFNGKTYASAKTDILSGTAAQAHCVDIDSLTTNSYPLVMESTTCELGKSGTCSITFTPSSGILETTQISTSCIENSGTTKSQYLCATCDINVDGNAYITGDLTVQGTITTTHSEEVVTPSENIILRDGATTPVASGCYSGFTVTNYDGQNHNLEVGADKDGTLHVGVVGGTMEPIATRATEACMENGYAAHWDSTGTDLVTKGATSTHDLTVNGNATVTGTLTADLTGTADNATCFNGCTYACAKVDILSGNAASATNSTCFGGCTYSQAKTDILSGCAADSAKLGNKVASCYIDNSSTAQTKAGNLSIGAPAACTTTSAGGTGNILGSTGIDIYGSTNLPHIHFHNNKYCGEYSARIANTTGRVALTVNNGTGCTAATEKKTFDFYSDGTFTGASKICASTNIYSAGCPVVTTGTIATVAPGYNCTGTSNYVVTTKVCCAEKADCIVVTDNPMTYVDEDTSTFDNIVGVRYGFYSGSNTGYPSSYGTMLTAQQGTAATSRWGFQIAKPTTNTHFYARRWVNTTTVPNDWYQLIDSTGGQTINGNLTIPTACGSFCGNLCGSAACVCRVATNCNSIYYLALHSYCESSSNTQSFVSNGCPITYNPSTGVLTTCALTASTVCNGLGVVNAAKVNIKASNIGLTAGCRYSFECVITQLTCCFCGQPAAYTGMYANNESFYVVAPDNSSCYSYKYTFEKLDTSNTVASTWQYARWKVSNNAGCVWTVTDITGATANDHTWQISKVGDVATSICNVPTSASTTCNVTITAGCCSASAPTNYTWCFCGCNGVMYTPGSIYVGSGGGRYAGGSAELYAPSPFIDFHFNNYCGDYSSRIINGSQGTTQIIVNNGTDSTAATQTATYCFGSNGFITTPSGVIAPIIRSTYPAAANQCCDITFTTRCCNASQACNYCMCLCGCNGKLYNPQGFMVGSCPVALVCDIPAPPTCVACATCVDLESWRDCDLYLVGTPHLGVTVSYDGPRRLVAAQKKNVSCLYYSYNGKNLYASGDKFTKDCQFVLSGCTLTITM